MATQRPAHFVVAGVLPPKLADGDSAGGVDGHRQGAVREEGVGGEAVYVSDRGLIGSVQKREGVGVDRSSNLIPQRRSEDRSGEASSRSPQIMSDRLM